MKLILDHNYVLKLYNMPVFFLSPKLYEIVLLQITERKTRQLVFGITKDAETLWSMLLEVDLKNCVMIVN